MRVGELQRIAAEIGWRRVVVLSDRYPPDAAGGAELSLHLLLREPVLRDQSLVVTFDKSLAGPRRRQVDGVDVLALPMNAAWPLHRLSQNQVERLKARPYGLKWAAFLAEAAGCALRDPKTHGPALALRLQGDPPGGVRMAHATIPEGRVQPEIRAVIDAVRPELVHADNARSIMMAADVLAGRPEPLVALVRDHRFTSLRFDQTLGPPDEARTVRDRLAARCAREALSFRQDCLRRATAVIATSAHLAGTLGEIAPGGRLRRLPLEPVELPRHEPAGNGEGFSILVVGTLTRNKGQTHLLEAWPAIAARIPDARLDFAGQGEDRAEIERMAARLGGGDRVRLHGHVTGEALAKLYRDCDVVALPTLWSEPFGRVPLEAGAAGRPVVAYASGGLAETVVDGVTGRLAPSRDVAAFADALAGLAADPQTRRRMGEAGRARIVETYAPGRLADLLAGVWDEAAGAVAPRRAHA